MSVQLLADFRPQTQTEGFCKARHEKRLERVEKSRRQVDQQKKKDIAAPVRPCDMKRGAA